METIDIFLQMIEEAGYKYDIPMCWDPLGIKQTEWIVFAQWNSSTIFKAWITDASVRLQPLGRYIFDDAHWFNLIIPAEYEALMSELDAQIKRAFLAELKEALHINGIRTNGRLRGLKNLHISGRDGYDFSLWVSTDTVRVAWCGALNEFSRRVRIDKFGIPIIRQSKFEHITIPIADPDVTKKIMDFIMTHARRSVQAAMARAIYHK